jgi:elongation factor Ts
MEITAARVKELRERTGSGMMECKRALVEARGDIDAAAEAMRKAGLAKADKKAGRTAAEGVIAIESSLDGKQAAMLEVNCETDFVAKGDEFQHFAVALAHTALDSAASDTDALLSTTMRGSNIDVNAARQALVAKLGEKVDVRRLIRLESRQGLIGSYLHGSRIGVLVEVQGGDMALARDLAMHVAASKPVCVDDTGVPVEMVAKEKEIFAAQAADSGKPAAIIEKMVEGRIKKFLAEITLLGQPFIKNPDISVGKLLQDKAAKVLSFQRFEVGEGIARKSENFAEEVMAQVRGS